VPGAAQAAEFLAAEFLAAEILASGDWAPQGGDAILIKGSNSVGLSVLVKALAKGHDTTVAPMAAGDD
jgi:UDP-N-acetylmuramoyl-tripeptide--D-alanyl-D-alanine ligase